MRGCFLLDRKLRSLSSKTLWGIALCRNRIMSQIRPAAGGEFRKRNSCYHIGNYSAILCDKNTLRVRMHTFDPADVYGISALFVRKQRTAGVFSCEISY